MPTLTISEETLTRIQSRAVSRSTSVEQVLQELLGDAFPDESPIRGEARRALIGEMDQEIKRSISQFPADFRLKDDRDTIYNEQMNHVIAKLP